MNRKILVTLFASLFASTAAVAGGMGKSSPTDFSAVDTNGDGYISKSEARNVPTLREQWSRADANGDGRLDQAEFAQIEVGESYSDE